MILGGGIQDRYGPKLGAVLGGILIAVVGGFVLWLQAGLLYSFASLAYGGYGLQSSLSAAAQGVKSGEYPAATAAFEKAQGSTVQLDRSVGTAQVDVIGRYRRGELTFDEASLAIEHYWAGALRRAVIEGDVEYGSLMAGQSVGLVREAGLVPAGTAGTTVADDPDLTPTSWAVAISLRVVLVENLRRLIERIVQSRADRLDADELADSLLGSGAPVRRGRPHDSGGFDGNDAQGLGTVARHPLRGQRRGHPRLVRHRHVPRHLGRPRLRRRLGRRPRGARAPGLRWRRPRARGAAVHPAAARAIYR